MGVNPVAPTPTVGGGGVGDLFRNRPLLGLWARILPLRTDGSRGFPRLGLYQRRRSEKPFLPRFGSPEGFRLAEAVQTYKAAFVATLASAPYPY